MHFRKAHLENVPVTEDLTTRLTSGAGPEVKSEGSTNTIEWEDDTISAAWGGYGDDKITGNSEANYIVGNRGADTISGGVGDDRIQADDGSLPQPPSDLPRAYNPRVDMRARGYGRADDCAGLENQWR